MNSPTQDNKPTSLEEILQELCDIVFQHGQATRTHMPFHDGEPMKDAIAAIKGLIPEKLPTAAPRGHMMTYNETLLNSGFNTAIDTIHRNLSGQTDNNKENI